MASGDTLFVFEPRDNENTAADTARPDVVNSQPVLKFSASSTEQAFFSSAVPATYSGGGLTCKVHVTMDTAVAGGIRLDIGVEAKADGEGMEADSFAAVQSASEDPVDGTAGNLMIVTITHTHAQADSPNVDEHIRFELFRDHDHIDDDASGEMFFYKLVVKET